MVQGNPGGSIERVIGTCELFSELWARFGLSALRTPTPTQRAQTHGNACCNATRPLCCMSRSLRAAEAGVLASRFEDLGFTFDRVLALASRAGGKADILRHH